MNRYTMRVRGRDCYDGSVDIEVVMTARTVPDDAEVIGDATETFCEKVL